MFNVVKRFKFYATNIGIYNELQKQTINVNFDIYHDTATCNGFFPKPFLQMHHL